MDIDKIIVKGARVHNLKNIDLELPRGKRFSTAVLNPGMIILILCCLALFAVTILGVV